MKKSETVADMADIAERSALAKKNLDRGTDLATMWAQAHETERVAAVLIGAIFLQRWAAHLMAEQTGMTAEQVMAAASHDLAVLRSLEDEQ